MKPLLCVSLYGIVAVAISTPAFSKEPDCAVARDPLRCEALEAARLACSTWQGQARSVCIRDALPAPDCSRAPSTAQCQERQAAAQACKDKRGRGYRKCLRNFRS